MHDFTQLTLAAIHHSTVAANNQDEFPTISISRICPPRIQK